MRSCRSAADSDQVDPAVTTYSYDARGRVQHVTHTDRAAFTFEYDALGNLLGTTATSNIEYAGSRPHAPTAADGVTLGYDSLGRQTYRSGAGVVGGEQNIEYTSFDLPRAITLGGSTQSNPVIEFEYDANGARTSMVDTLGRRTRNLGRMFRRLDDPGDSSFRETAFAPLPDGSQVVFDHTSDGGASVSYAHTDRLGSVVLRTAGEVPSVLEEREYEPFGTPFGGLDAEALSFGFTGHEHESETGLVNMLGRLYDPALGTFLTPDPVISAPFNSQGWNPYSYVLNDPMNMVDPTGFEGEATSGETEYGEDEWSGLVVTGYPNQGGGSSSEEAPGSSGMEAPTDPRSGFESSISWDGGGDWGSSWASDAALEAATFNSRRDAAVAAGIVGGFSAIGQAAVAALAPDEVDVVIYTAGLAGGLASAGAGVLAAAATVVARRAGKFARVLNRLLKLQRHASRGGGVRRTLYHYTDDAGLEGITSSRKLNASTKARNPNDVRYGDGQYLTDVIPGTKTNAQLSRQFINNPFQGNKFKNFVEIDVTDLNVVKGREGVYVVPGTAPLDLTNRLVRGGAN